MILEELRKLLQFQLKLTKKIQIRSIIFNYHLKNTNQTFKQNIRWFHVYEIELLHLHIDISLYSNASKFIRSLSTCDPDIDIITYYVIEFCNILIYSIYVKIF